MEVTDAMHKELAIHFHGRYWKLFQQDDLDESRLYDLLNAAYASLTHWKAFSGCTVVNEQRGEYLVAKAWLRMGHAAGAALYAERCLKLTLDKPEAMEDFDIAYAYELMAKSDRLSGRTASAERNFGIAREKGAAIANKEDREWFLKDLEAPC